jgi:alpha-ketoglutarate-dependent 2,4-dichlorophenoxyacetate dioxygenase
MHRGGDFDYGKYKRDMRRTTVREGTEPHQMETGDDPFAELFQRTPRTVDIQKARYAGR